MNCIIGVIGGIILGFIATIVILLAMASGEYWHKRD